jgi:hypothetical protein
MITAVAAAAMPVPVNVLAGEQPVNGILKIRLGATSSFDQCNSSSGMRNEDMTQAVAALAAELHDHLGDIGDKTSSGTQLHDIGIHFPIISTAGADLPLERDPTRAFAITSAKTYPNLID